MIGTAPAAVELGPGGLLLDGSAVGVDFKTGLAALEVLSRTRLFTSREKSLNQQLVELFDPKRFELGSVPLPRLSLCRRNAGPLPGQHIRN